MYPIVNPFAFQRNLHEGKEGGSFSSASCKEWPSQGSCTVSAVPVFLLNNVLSYHCHYFLVARDILYEM
jgi:hypothetical protein